DAERAVLSAMMLDREASSRLTVRPRPADFGLPLHQLLARAIVALRMKGEPVDPVTVGAEIRASGVRLSGPELAEVAAIVDATPDHLHVAAHAKIVVDLARQRRAVEALDRKRVEGYERHED